MQATEARRWSFCQSSYGPFAESLKVHSSSGKMIYIHLSDDAASEKDDNMDLRVLYILDRCGVEGRILGRGGVGGGGGGGGGLAPFVLS